MFPPIGLQTYVSLPRLFLTSPDCCSHWHRIRDLSSAPGTARGCAERDL